MRTKAHQDAIDNAELCGTNWCQQYALDCGWDYDAVKATAERGATYADILELGAGAAGELVQWSREFMRELEANHD